MNSTELKRVRFTRWLKRFLKLTLLAALIYVAVLLVGLIPVNNDFESADDGVTLYVVSNAVHADIIVPRKHAGVDWGEAFSFATFPGDVSSQTHVAIGWGDRGFFLETQTWDDLKLSVAAKALFLPSESCVHVSFTAPEYYSNSKSETVSHEQYLSLVEFIKQTLAKQDDGQYCQIDGYAYSTNDAFFKADGQYHLLNTCNSWVGRGLKAAGVKVPWLSPMPGSPTMYFEP